MKPIRSFALTMVALGASLAVQANPALVDADLQRAELRYVASEVLVQFRAGHEWLSWNRNDHLIVPLADPRASKDPAAAPDEDALRELQLRLITTLKRQKEEKDEERARDLAERRADPTRAPAPVRRAGAERPDRRGLAALRRA